MDLERVGGKNAGLSDEIRTSRTIKGHVNNEDVCRKVQETIGEYDELLVLVKKNGNCGGILLSY